MEAAEIKFMKTATKHDITCFVYENLLSNGWKSSINYVNFTPKRFFATSLQIPSGSCADFEKYVNYCYLLSNNFTDVDEAAKYTDKHGTSIYFSVVLYWLLSHFGVVREKDLKFCQGYFSYKIEKTSPSTRYRAGMHSWLYYNRSVIDVTVWRQKDCFDFAKRGFDIPVIKGEIPPGLNLFGFEEDRSLAKEYARRFARDSSLNFYDWINFHKQQAELLAAFDNNLEEIPK